MKSDIFLASLSLAPRISLAPADLHLQGAATFSFIAVPSSACCRSPVHPPPLTVPTVRGIVPYSVEFINLFTTPIEGALHPLEMTPSYFKQFSERAVDK